MRIQILIAILLVGLTTQQCAIGCLRCNSLNQCVVCDITNNYFLSGNTCALSTQTNCALIAQNGNCVQCNANFYMDINSQRCLAVTTTNLVNQCSTYNSGQICTACNGNFFVAAGRCAAVNVTIANCVSYVASNSCFACASGFVLSNDLTTCVTMPANQNCLFFTYIGCKQCNTGFIINPNFYFTNFVSPTYINGFLTNVVQPTPSSWFSLSVCQPVIVNNCATLAAFNVCTACNPGYYLQNGNCVAFPLSVIWGCLTYSSLNVCASCQVGMYLSQNTCLNNVVIANCLTYSGSASSTTCAQCTNAFFLQGNTCVNRTVSASIANCQSTVPSADLCQACATGFVLSTDSRACLALIANCAAYSASTFQTVNLQCSSCVNGFYLSTTGITTVCVAGTVAYCQNYTVNANTCTQCQNMNYLSNGVCIAHVVIPNCVTYDPVRPNFCLTCSSGFYNFAYTTTCVQTTVRTGCAAYSVDGNSCVTCLAGYWLSSGNCNVIPATFSNCASFSGTICTLCNAGYMVNTLPTVGTCVLPLDYINIVTSQTSNFPNNAAPNSACAVMNNPLIFAPAAIAGVATPSYTLTVPTWTGTTTATAFPLTCLTCNNYMYGYTPSFAESICVLSSQLTMYNGFVAVSNCKRYGLSYSLTAYNVVCMECNSGFYISGYQDLAHTTTATTCVSSCASATSASNAILPDDLLGFVNICVANVVASGAIRTSGGCQRYARNRGQFLNPLSATTLTSATATSTDWQCIVAAPQPSSNPNTNLLLLTISAATPTAVGWYTYEVISTTTPLTDSYDFTTGYSNTVDSASVVPTVFNYKGIMAGFIDTTLAAALVGGTNLLNNNLSNCDLVMTSKSSTGFALGSSFNAETTNLMYLAATVDKDYYSCMRCSFGFQLSFTLGNTQPTNPAFPSCVQMTNCASSSTVYGGLPTFLNSLFSCHTCAQTSGQANFPTVWIETDGITPAPAANIPGAFIGYTTGSMYTSETAVASSHGFRCAAAPTTLLTADTPTTASAISNCAAYGVISPVTAYANPTGPTNAVIGTIRNVCLACAANYYPVFLSVTTPQTAASSVAGTTKVPGWTVVSCSASANCDTSVVTQFNSCAKCNTNLENAVVPVFYAFMDFTLTNCYQSFSQNCFILSPTGLVTTATNSICGVCKAGFFKNADNVCEVYKVPNESASTGVFTNAYYAAQVFSSTPAWTIPTAAATDRINVRQHYLLSYRAQQYGVNTCSTGWVQAPANPWAPRVCVWSSYVYNTTGSYPASSAFINNCVRYNLTQVSSKNVCGGCGTGYIPTSDGLTCVSNTGLPNCVFAQTGSNTGLCFQCATNFNNVNGQCVSTTIPNCATYVNTVWSFSTPGTLQCSSCISGFVLSNDFLSCTAGNILNCITYTQGQPNTCTACAAGFVQMTLSVNYCYPIPTALNCAQLGDSSSTSGANLATISCARCNASPSLVFGARTWTTLGLTNVAQTLCMPFTPISNCLTYDQDSIIIRPLSFTCKQCSSGFWFSATNSTCVPRVNMPSQCLSFSLTADVCLTCASGTFLSVNGAQCVNFPTGIYNCAIYSGPNTCTRCVAGSFLSSNQCVASTLVNNCAIYAANFTCSACNSGFFLLNSTACVVPTATNCQAFTSISVCSSCAVGWGLQTTNGVTSCVLVNLANCVNATTVAPFTCLVCATQYFPNSNGVCVMSPQNIVNCLVYDTASTCITCSPGTVLNVARTVCNSTFYQTYIDPNCAQSFLTSTPQCTNCALGSFFANGTCTACSNNTVSSGCLSCDPNNNNVCLFCSPGYYMNAQGGCVSNNPIVTPVPTPTPNNTASAPLAKALALSAALVTLYFEAL